MIKLPLVRDSLLLVLNQFDEPLMTPNLNERLGLLKAKNN